MHFIHFKSCRKILKYKNQDVQKCQDVNYHKTSPGRPQNVSLLCGKLFIAKIDQIPMENVLETTLKGLPKTPRNLTKLKQKLDKNGIKTLLKRLDKVLIYFCNCTSFYKFRKNVIGTSSKRHKKSPCLMASLLPKLTDYQRKTL